MRIALISDIHGNAIALEAVLAEVDGEEVDRTICLGDIATLGGQPREVLDILRDRRMVSVLGNHDEFLLVPELIHQYATGAPIEAAVDWCRDQLRPADFAYLRTFQPELTVPLDDGFSLCLFHGSPRSHMEVLLATTPADELDTMLDGRHGALLAGGHTHIQMLRQHRGRLLVNPGSVGMPFAEHIGANPNAAPRILAYSEYAIVSVGKGRISVDLRRIELDRKRLREAALASAVPLRGMLAAQYS